MIFTSVSSLITVGSGFPASLQAFGLLDAAEGAVYGRVLRAQFAVSSFAYTEVNSSTWICVAPTY